VIARRVLGVTLAAMGAGQLADVGGFREALAAFGLPQLSGAAGAIAAADALVGALLVLAPSRRGAVGGLVLSVGWSALAAQAFARGRRVPNCACFGRFAPQPLRWWVLAEDAALVALAVRATRAE